MEEPVSRSVVQAFYEAYASRDPIRIAAFLCDDVEWHMAGPTDVFAFCGYRRGKAAVVDYFGRLVPDFFAVKRLEPEDLVIDGARAAVFSKVTAVQKKTGRIISYHCAHFVTFHDGKVVRMQGISDTFDVAEQVVGHRIDAYRDCEQSSADDVVTI
jgi:ketosteroid isomerase-like protein